MKTTLLTLLTSAVLALSARAATYTVDDEVSYNIGTGLYTYTYTLTQSGDRPSFIAFGVDAPEDAPVSYVAPAGDWEYLFPWNFRTTNFLTIMIGEWTAVYTSYDAPIVGLLGINAGGDVSYYPVLRPDTLTVPESLPAWTGGLALAGMMAAHTARSRYRGAARSTTV